MILPCRARLVGRSRGCWPHPQRSDAVPLHCNGWLANRVSLTDEAVIRVAHLETAGDRRPCRVPGPHPYYQRMIPRDDPRRTLRGSPRSPIGRLSAREGRFRMFLGTPRKWWIAAAVPLVLGFVLLATGDGTMLRTAAAVLLLLLAMVLFGMAPMRYGQSARTPPSSAAETLPTTPSDAIDPPRPRALIEGRDPSEV